MYRSDTEDMIAAADMVADMEAARAEEHYHHTLSVLQFYHEHDERNEAVNSIADYLECGGITILCE
jgi:subtilase family serine protease